jgi:hypothetical protein
MKSGRGPLMLWLNSCHLSIYAEGLVIAKFNNLKLTEMLKSALLEFWGP